MKPFLLCLFLCPACGISFGAPAWRDPPSRSYAEAHTVLTAEQNDSLVALLLSPSDFGATKHEAEAYAHDCERAIAGSPNSPLKLDMYMRIGDVYYGLKKYRAMALWYRKVLSMNPAMENTTPIGARLHEFAIDAIRSYILMAAYVAYAILACFLLSRIISGWGTFLWLSFFKRETLFLTLFCVCAGLVFLIDAKLSEKAAFTITTGELHALWPETLTKPFIPLSILDAQPWNRALIVLALGFLPIGMAVYYTSFGKPFSRKLLFALVGLAILSMWSNFFVITAFDGKLRLTAILMKTRVWYKESPETLLLRDPGKALRANPDLLKSNNEDLLEFVKKQYPDGLLKPK